MSIINKDFSFSIKMVRKYKDIVFLFISIVGFLFFFFIAETQVERYIKSKDIDKFLNIDLDSFTSYDPYYERKVYLPVPEKIGYKIEKKIETHVNYLEANLSPNCVFQFAFYINDVLIDDFLIDTSQSSKIVYELPKLLKNSEFLTLYITPIKGSNYYISYLNFLEKYEENVILQEFQESIPSMVYGTNILGDPHLITGIIAYFKEVGKSNLEISIGNIGPLPVELVSMVYKEKEYFFNYKESLVPINNGSVTYVDFEFMELDSDICINLQDLFINYKYKNDTTIHRVPIYFYSQRNDDVFYGTVIRETDTTTHFPFITMKENKIFFEGKKFLINKPLILPPGKEVVLQEGQVFDLSDGAFILSYSPVIANGTLENPISIISTSGTGGGIAILQTESKSIINYVDFDNLSNPISGIWNLSGAVTFYEADVEIKNSTFQNNRSEDALNIVRSNFFMSDNIFSHTFADAFDSDFSDGYLENSYFNDTGNDGVDVSTSNVTVKNTVFNTIGDKGLSCGENSVIMIENIKINHAVIGITSKDFSTISGDNVEISNIQIGIALYQKKPEFGPANINLTNTKIKGLIGLDYLIQDGSSLILNGQEIIPRSKKKEKVILDKLIAGEKISW